MLSVVYPDELTFNIVSQSGLNDVKVDSETNAVFNLLKVFCFCSVHHHRISLINFIRGVATSAKDLMNC